MSDKIQLKHTYQFTYVRYVFKICKTECGGLCKTM